jgi:hypothetical protein
VCGVIRLGRGSHATAGRNELPRFDVNINPGVLSTIIHDRSPWDEITHSSFDDSDRIAVRNTFFALPAAQQTWKVGDVNCC